MKSRTSFFNPAVLRKDITRFAPAWGLYTVFSLLTVFLFLADQNDPAWIACDAPYIMQLMGIVNFGYGGICAILLFGDLFQSKMAGSLHAMPMRREGWFLTHLCAGLLFCFVPNAIGAVIACMMLQQYCYLAFLWLALMLLQFLFFFGVGAFSAQCAGNRLGAVAVYVLTNLLAVLAAFLVDTFYAPVLYGIKTNWEAICTHSPVVGFSAFEYVSVEYDNMNGTARFEGYHPEQWRYLFVAAGVGVALLGASVLLYRRRHMECAGDLIAVKPAAPIFLTIYTLCVGAVLYFIADQLNTDLEYIFLLIGFAIGFFTGSMLLEKKVNVFRLKKWIGFGALTLAFFLTMAVAWMDPMGITRYVPEASRVECVYVSPYASDWYLENRAEKLTDPQDVQTVLDIHSQVIRDRYDDRYDGVHLNLRYKLRGGTTVDRKYWVNTNTPAGAELKKLLSRFSYVTGVESPAALAAKAEFLDYRSHTVDPSYSFYVGQNTEDYEKYGEDTISIGGEAGRTYLLGLLEAMERDCQAGTMAQPWEFHSGLESEGYITICYELDRYTSEYIDITVFADCKNTIAYLKTLPTTAE